MPEHDAATAGPQARKAWYRRGPARLFILVGFIYLAWCGVVFFKQTELVFPRQFANANPGQRPVRPDVEELWLNTPDGARVEARLFRSGPRQERAPERRPCVIIFHGNADLIDHMDAYADVFQAQGLHVCLAEYRGYGRSSGTPGEPAVIADAVQLFDLLAARPEIDPARIVLYGRSLGCAVAAQLAARRPPAALVLESPFTSIASFASQYGVPSFLVRHPFRTDRVLPDIAAAGVPILILHSRSDEIIPFHHAQRLAALAPRATLIEISGGHNDSPLTQQAYERAIHDLLEPLIDGRR